MQIDRQALTTLRGVASIFGGGVIIAALAWMTPGSPVELWRADAAAAEGSAGAALALYDDVAAHGWWVSMRQRALRRSASILSAELDDPSGALQRLELLLALTQAPDERATLRTRQGHLHLAERDTKAAGRAFYAAFRAAPQASAAGSRLVLAARAHAEAGDVALSTQYWRTVVEHYPAERATAQLALARNALTNGQSERALFLFDQALAAAQDPDVAAAARLGTATSLERLGDLDEAIAEIDQVDLPGRVRDRRMDGLRKRRDQRQR